MNPRWSPSVTPLVTVCVTDGPCRWSLGHGYKENLCRDPRELLRACSSVIPSVINSGQTALWAGALRFGLRARPVEPAGAAEETSR